MKVLEQMGLPGGRAFKLVEGSLLEEPVDAIVNAANGQLAHGGGVAAVIARAAGRELDRDGRAQVRDRGPVHTGQALVTTAGDLPFEGVIHAVGPRLGEGGEEDKLSRAVANALLRAHERGWRSLAFPAISSGIFAVPLDVCARAYLAGVTRHFDEHPDSSLEEVRLCVFAGPLVDEVKSVMDAAGDDQAAGGA